MIKIDENKFKKIRAQVRAMHDEIGILSKKSPTDPVNVFKLKSINLILKEANALLGKKYLPLEGFAQFDLDEIPNNSDVAFILNQYMSCFVRMAGEEQIY